MVDWSAGRAARAPKADAIWIGMTRSGREVEPEFCGSRQVAERRLSEIISEEHGAGRRCLIGFDFPFGYPAGFSRIVCGSSDPLELWARLALWIEDQPDGENNRFAVAETMNALFDGPGPFWGKPNERAWPGIPYRKQGIRFDQVAEKRRCDEVARAASSCFQLFFNPTVGSQVLMGLPVLHRLREAHAGLVRVWPFEDVSAAPIVFAEVWPGLIQAAVRAARASDGADRFKDAVQVRLLARALSRVQPETLSKWMHDLPPEAQEEAWILGAEHGDVLTELAQAPLAPPPLRNDCFALPPGVRWTPVDEALDILRTRLHPVVSGERLPLPLAGGRILAQDAQAARSNPPQANSAVDGYGMRGGLADGVEAVLPLHPGRAAAGGPFTGKVPEGEALRILTGAPIPAGIDTVVLEEDVTLAEGSIALRGPLKTGANTRKAGEDVLAGDTVCAAGTQIGAPELALLSAVGVSQVEVYRPLRVAVLSTGDELVDADTAAAPGQIGDANRPMLAAMMQRWGHEVIDLGIQPDDRTMIRAALDRGAQKADVILTSGGASAGDEDHVSALLRASGALQSWRIAIKPGRPLALALWEGVPVFGLPGNPVAAMVCTLVFARPALSLLAGRGWQAPQGYDLPAAFSKSKKPGRREFLRARVRDGAVEVFRSEGSGRISGLVWADGLAELPDGAMEVRPGTPVRYYPWGSFGL